MASGSSGVADAGTAHGAEGMAAGSPAVVGRVFTMDDLALISQAQKQERGHDQPWALNNQALKCLRWVNEDPVGVPTCRRWEFDFAGLLTIGVMDHDVKGPGFSLTAAACVGQSQFWSPAQFLSQLRSSSVEEFGLKEHGVKQLTFECMPGSLDKLRLLAAQQAGDPFPAGATPPIWDFVLTRGDGEQYALHPRHHKFKCDVKKHSGEVGRGTGPAREKIKQWKARTYDEVVMGFYEEGLDPARDEHRRKHLESQRKGGASSAAAGPASAAAAASAAAGPSSAAAAASSAAPPPWATPDRYRGYYVYWHKDADAWAYHDGHGWQWW